MAKDQISFSTPSRRVKFGEFLLSSGEGNPADDESSSTSSATGTPPRLSEDQAASPYNGTLMSSPWSQSSYSSPYVKSPWMKLSPFQPHDRRRSTNYTLIGSLIREEGHVYSIACSHDFLYTGSDSRSIRVWTKDHLRDTGGFKSSSGLVKAIVVDPNKGKVYTGHQDGKIRVWRASGSGSSEREHKRVGSLPTWKEYLKSSVNPRNYVEVRRHRRVLPVKHYDAVSCFAVNEEAGLLYSGSWDKTVKVWRLADGRCLESIAAHDDAVNAVAVGFDGLVFTGSADGTVKVWRRELQGNKTRHVYVQTLLDQTCAVTSLAVSSGSAGEGSVLYSSSSDGLVNFWEWRKELSYGGVLRGHKLAALSLAVAGQLVFSGSADNSICVWRREPGGAHVCLAVLTGHAGPVKCLAVEEDDGGDESEDEARRRWIVYSGSLDNSVKVWRVYDNNAGAA